MMRGIRSTSCCVRSLRLGNHNWRKHQEDRSAITRGWEVDRFSSAPLFRDWQEHRGKTVLLEHPPRYDPLVVDLPRTWLLRAGWKISGSISYRAVPSALR